MLHLVKQNRIYAYEYMSDFKKFKEQLTSKEKCYSWLNLQKINEKECELVLNDFNKF